jgi:hypothetical protein
LKRILVASLPSGAPDERKQMTISHSDNKKLSDSLRSVDLALAPLRELQKSDDPLLGEFAIALIEQMELVKKKLTRVVGLIGDDSAVEPAVAKAFDFLN